MGVARSVLRIDAPDSLRSPWLEALVAILLAVSTLTVLGRPGVSSYVLVTHYLGTLKMAAVLYMAMLAGSLASALENGYASTLMQAPSPRALVAMGLLASRVLLPAGILTAASAVGFVLLLWGVADDLAWPAAINYSFTFLELVGYGSAFMLTALITRSSSKTIIASLMLYLVVGMGGEALVFLGLALSSRAMVMAGLLGNPAEAAGIYAGYVDLGGLVGGEALTPLIAGSTWMMSMMVLAPIYFERWMEA
ncbi:MAG: hypothetical protein QI199_03365 [Candidatus Korarchaeota archaeon]|nr:hypothetical protein [Candidatus Korarchaeota archaeon]